MSILCPNYLNRYFVCENSNCLHMIANNTLRLRLIRLKNYVVIMLNFKTISSIVWLISSLTFIGYLSNSVNAIPSDLVDDKYVFGPLIGVTANESGKVDWVMTGTWRSILTNDMTNNTNENATQNDPPFWSI